jgi:hypothetical protein
MISARRTSGRLGMLAVVIAITSGCGGSSSDSAGSYPVVEDLPVGHQPPVTTPNGAVVTKPALPTVYEVEPSPSCEGSYVTSRDGGQRRVAIPPRPGLRAVAVTEHTTRLEWWFDELPSDCSPVRLYLSVEALTDVSATPWVERDVEVDGLSGSKEVTYPDFLPVPDVARASAYLPDGRRSRIATVLIERPANTPPDPPEPVPPVTAPAGGPVVCTSEPTIVKEAAGDVLTYSPGNPPKQVRRMTPALSGIDITRARIQIDGLTVCATFSLAEPPPDGDFQLSFNLSSPPAACCGTLQFKRSAGRLEVGRHFVDTNGVYRLEAVENAGASLQGRTLVITGTLPQPEEPPVARNLHWSVTTGYFPEKYGPYFGDWLPRHEAIDQPSIRHRDGSIVGT